MSILKKIFATNSNSVAEHRENEKLEKQGSKQAALEIELINQVLRVLHGQSNETRRTILGMVATYYGVGVLMPKRAVLPSDEAVNG